MTGADFLYNYHQIKAEYQRICAHSAMTWLQQNFCFPAAGQESDFPPLNAIIFFATEACTFEVLAH